MRDELVNKLAVVLGGVSLLFVTACHPNELMESSEVRASRHAQETARVETVVFVGTQAGTLVAMQSTVDGAASMATQLSQLQQEGAYLQATIDAVTTLGVPVQPRYTPTVVAAAAPIAGMSIFGEGLQNTDYTDIRTATDVDGDGCPTDKRGRFSETIGRVYFTTLGVGVVAGTRHQVRWLFGDEFRSQSQEWVADRDYDEVCIYFWLNASDTRFEAGLWKADLMINGTLFVEVPFELCQAGELC